MITAQPWRRLIKIVAFIAIILLPLLVVVLVFKPFVREKVIEDAVNAYQLPDNYTHEDVITVVAKMRRDAQFSFYFYALTEEQIADAVGEAIEVLLNNRAQWDLFRRIEEVSETVVARSRLFYHMDYRDDFFNDPSAFPELNMILYDFLQEEFKMTILGTCYKATFDRGFVFQWDKMSRLAAIKLKRVVYKIYEK